MNVKDKTPDLSDVKGGLKSGRPYAERLLHDEELRETIQHAIKAGRGIYRELKGESATTAAERLARDKKLRKHMGHLIDDGKEARSRLQGKKSHKLRTLVLLGLLAGGVYALRDRLSGDEFGS